MRITEAKLRNIIKNTIREAIGDDEDLGIPQGRALDVPPMSPDPSQPVTPSAHPMYTPGYDTEDSEPTDVLTPDPFDITTDQFRGEDENDNVVDPEQRKVWREFLSGRLRNKDLIDKTNRNLGKDITDASIVRTRAGATKSVDDFLYDLFRPAGRSVKEAKVRSLIKKILTSTK